MQQTLYPLNPKKSIITPNGWQIILLNSLHPGKVSGWLDQAELQHLTTCLRNPDYKHALVFLHHHPVSVDCDWLEPLGLKNPDALFDAVAKDNRVRVIGWGHIHQVFEEQRQGIKYLSAPSTSIQFLPHSKEFALDIQHTPGYRCFELLDNGAVNTWVRRLEHFSAPYDLTAKGY